jgi:hypothetical protein
MGKSPSDGYCRVARNKPLSIPWSELAHYLVDLFWVMFPKRSSQQQMQERVVRRIVRGLKGCESGVAYVVFGLGGLKKTRNGLRRWFGYEGLPLILLMLRAGIRSRILGTLPWPAGE